MGMGLWVAGSSPLTVGGNCVNMVKAQNEEDDDDNEVVDDDNVASGGQDKGSAERWPLEVVMRSGHSCFTLCLCVFKQRQCVRVREHVFLHVCVCVCVR